MNLQQISYSTLIKDFTELTRIQNRINTKYETTVRIGVWHTKPIAIKTCLDKREATIYSKIKPHTNIVKLLSVIYEPINNDKYLVHIVMEGNGGVTLLDAIRYSNYDLNEGLDIMIDVVNGLCHIHDSGIIHHDIKPSNILLIKNNNYHLDDDDDPGIVYKICDFGLSDYVDSKGHGSEKYRCYGTDKYLAPEKHKNSTIPITTSVDIFAVGVLGTMLVDNGFSSRIDKYYSIMKKCQAINPEERPTAKQLLQELLLLRLI